MAGKLLQILALIYLVPAALVNGENTSETHNKMSVAELDLNEGDIELLTRFGEQIHHASPPMESLRESKAFKDASLRQAAEALTDDEITDIIKSITFPKEENITEDTEDREAAASALPSEVEPRTTSQRKGRGYYIIAYTPFEESAAKESVPYARLQILPAERSANGDSTSPESRMVSKKSWNKYINRLMRQIRRGTRKIQRKTRVKKLKQEPTLENFLKGMYKISKEQRLRQQKKKTSSWFLW